MDLQNNADRQLGRLKFGKVKRFQAEESGATMIEFALVALPFFFLLGSIFEFSLRFFVSTLMDHAVADVARLIRTQQVTAQNTTEQEFKNMICARPAMSVFSCGNLTVDVHTIDTFSNPAVPRNQDGSLNNANMGFQPGGPNSINVLRVYYDWPRFMAWQEQFSHDATPNGHLLTTTAAFVIEP